MGRVTFTLTTGKRGGRQTASHGLKCEGTSTGKAKSMRLGVCGKFRAHRSNDRHTVIPQHDRRLNTHQRIVDRDLRNPTA